MPVPFHILKATRRIYLSAFTLGLLLMAGQAGAASDQDALQKIPVYSGVGDRVSVAGNTLLRNDRPWTPHGYLQIAFVKPPTVFVGGAVTENFANAAAHYTPREYLDMRAAGADSVRIQVAQPGLDWHNADFSVAFRDKVIGAIAAARAAGLVVIVSVQDEAQTGESKTTKLPDDATRRVLEELASAFGDDSGVMLELYNEPELPVNAANWKLWKAAMDTAIAAVRDTGAHNVIVADGLDYAESLAGAPPLSDPLGQVVYAVHPYAHEGSDQSVDRWNSTFGDYARTRAPVLVTEWGIGYYCNHDTPLVTRTFLRYLDHEHVGLEAVTWDWQPSGFGSALYDFPDLKLSRYIGTDGARECHEAADPGKAGGQTAVIPAGDGPGAMIETWYETGIPPDDVE